VFRAWIRGDHLALTANPDYWGGRPKIDTWYLRIVKDKSVRVAQLQTGEIDYTLLQPGPLLLCRTHATCTSSPRQAEPSATSATTWQYPCSRMSVSAKL
jgi:ABC-type transport system substrate-binding protein